MSRAMGAPAGDAGGAPAGGAARGGGTPAGNTGVEIAFDAFGVGWLGLTVWVVEKGAALEYLAGVLGELRARSVATRGYTAAWNVLDASTVSVSDRRPGEIHVELTQGDCERLGGAQLHELAAWAEKQERWKCSRLDLNYDDRARLVEPRAVYEAFERGDRVSHVQEASLTVNTTGGATCYFGRPKSQQRLRVYDKDAEQGSSGHGVRWEWQGRDEAATEMLAVWFGLNGELGLSVEGVRAAFWARIRRFVDFVAADSAQHQEDRRALSWWQALIAGASKMRPRRVEVVPPSFVRTAAWIRLQVAPSLAYLVAEVRRSGHGGREWLDSVIEDGAASLRAREGRTWAAVGV